MQEGRGQACQGHAASPAPPSLMAVLHQTPSALPFGLPADVQSGWVRSENTIEVKRQGPAKGLWKSNFTTWTSVSPSV